MLDSMKQWIEKKGIEKWFQRDNLIILVLSGILLFIIALPAKDHSADAASGRTDHADSGTTGESILGQSFGLEGSLDTAQDSSSQKSFSEEDYCTYLEEKLKDTLSGMSGVGKVQVMITLKSSEELVVEKDKPVSRSSTNEQDSQGGSRINNQVDSSETTIYKTQGSDSEPYVVKTLLPEVEGVVVVAQGAGNGDVNKSITEIVQALFNVEAHKVKVVKMQTTN